MTTEHMEAPVASEAPTASSTQPAERVKRPTRPDESAAGKEIKSSIDALQAAIVKNKKRVEEIKQIIDDRKSGKGEANKEQQAIKNKLAELRGQFQALVSQKQQTRAQLDLASKARDSARSSMKELKGTMKFTKVEDIDAHINELEHRIQHDTLTLNEEKKVLEQIKALKKSRTSIGELTSKVAKLEADTTSVDGLRDGIKGIDDAINKVRAQEDELRAQLAAMRAEQAETGTDIPALVQERDECRELCKQAYQKIQDLRADLDAQWATYKETNAIFRAQVQEDRKKRQEDYLKQKAERDAERAERMAEQAPEPFDREITLCDQLGSYLKKYVAAAEAAAEVEAKDLSGALEGFKPIAKKALDEEDTWLLGKKKGAKGKAKKEEKKAGPEKLVHSLDILEAFATLKLEVPLTSDKCEPLLPVVAAKKEHFLQRRKEAKEAPPAPEQPTEAEDAAAKEDAPAEAAAEGDAKPKAKKGKPAAAPPKLDDAASWPSIGGVVAAPPAKAAAAAADEEDEASEDEPASAEASAEEGEIVGEKKKGWGTAAGAAANGAVAVKLDVSPDGKVALTLSA